MFSMRSCWSRHTNFLWSLRISAPGSRWDSHRIWKPLQMPSTGIPPFAASTTSVITGANRAIARFAPVMAEVVDAAKGGMPVLGICNGFQILCESHLLPGALIRNDHRKFNCVDQRLVVENASTAWTSDFEAGQEITVVLKNGEGGFVADERTLDELEGEGRVVFRYAGDNPNGSYRAIAGITNDRGNIVGLMPHPEHCIEEGYGPSTDGLPFFTSVLKAMASA